MAASEDACDKDQPVATTSSEEVAGKDLSIAATSEHNSQPPHYGLVFRGDICNCQEEYKAAPTVVSILEVPEARAEQVLKDDFRYRVTASFADPHGFPDRINETRLNRSDKKKYSDGLETRQHAFQIVDPFYAYGLSPGDFHQVQVKMIVGHVDVTQTGLTVITPKFDIRGMQWCYVKGHCDNGNTEPFTNDDESSSNNERSSSDDEESSTKPTKDPSRSDAEELLLHRKDQLEKKHAQRSTCLTEAANSE